MRFSKTLIAAASVAAAAWMPAHAFEAGAAGWAQKPGITLGGTSGEGPPPGLYMVDQAFIYQTNLTGAGAGADAINPHGTKTGAPAAVAATAFVWAPGWNFLGASYNAALAIPVGHVRCRQSGECRSLGHDQHLYRAGGIELEVRGQRVLCKDGSRNVRTEAPIYRR
jgi:hypothetical protein